MMAYKADPSRANTSLLLPFTGANGVTTFTDLSPSPKTVTAHNSAALTTAQQGIAAGSCLSLNRSSTDWVDAANSTDFDFGSGDFTIEFFAKQRSLPPSFAGLVCKRATSAVFAPFNIFVNSDGSWSALASKAAAGWDVACNIGPGDLGVFNVFVHMLFARSGTTFFAGSNGIVKSKVTVSGALMTNTDAVSIGTGAITPTVSFDGWINHLRITKGVCRYTAAAVSASYQGISVPPAGMGSFFGMPDIPWPTT